ncbi:sulfur oxidation c-type cytochrome SoxX [Paracoccus thiocyanatus]|uniref:sulfur oxidation c-type cytochrome SoxX n=1 Tax=Paracoccus thiocyanatus TaxID=34006 RepID=UPI0021620218|nr:sulfur oxidation c-type cytochrome SoxX [Paracoccus thiocyanatus]
MRHEHKPCPGSGRVDRPGRRHGAAAAAAETPPAATVFEEDGSIAQSLSGAPGDPQAGRQTMEARGLGNCYACHLVEATPDIQFMGDIGPALHGAGSRWSAAQLRGIVADAKHTFPDSMMPSFYKSAGFLRPGEGYTAKPATEPLPPLLTAQQVEDVVSYLLSLK